LKKTKICFLILDGYSLFNDSADFYFGGAELRASVIAKSLSKKFENLDIYCITKNHGQLPKQKMGNVTVVASNFYISNANIGNVFSKAINFLYLNFTKVKSLFLSGKAGRNSYLCNYNFDAINADIYASFALTGPSTELINYCKEKNKKYLHFIASDLHLDFKKYPNYETLINSIGKQVSLILTQNKFQTAGLKEMGFSSYMLKNPVDLHSRYSKVAPELFTVLWIGKDNDVKNPGLCLRLAHQNPDIKFIMICNKSGDEYTFDISSLPTNVEFYEYVKICEVEKYFSKTSVFLSTSVHEGFPNTFLQAAKYSLPVLSYAVNPNDYLTENSCGICCNTDVQLLQNNLKKLAEEKELVDNMGEAHRLYLIANHNSETIVQALYDQILLAGFFK